MTVGILGNFWRSLPELDLDQGVKMILSSWLFPSIGDEEGESRLFSTWAKKNGSLGRCPPRRGCGRGYLNQCCIPGAKLPLYAFRKLNVNDDDTGSLGHEKIEPPVAFLDSLLLREWEDRMQRGLFRYDVTACETK